MDITLTLQDLTLSDADRTLVLAAFADVLGTARDLSGGQGSFTVVIRLDEGRPLSEQQRCEVTVQIGDTVIRAEDGAAEIAQAAAQTAVHMREHLARYKASLSNREGEGGALIPPSTLDKLTAVHAETLGPQITKRKQFSSVAPMTEQEAIERMELIGHTFFLFFNAQTNRSSVVYKREDGHYGLIEPADTAQS